jgi:hypothetical protein
MWPFNTGECLIEVTAWAGLTVHIHSHILVIFNIRICDRIL